MTFYILFFSVHLTNLQLLKFLTGLTSFKTALTSVISYLSLIIRSTCFNWNNSLKPIYTQQLRFKKQFKQLNFYSMPNSILFVVKKRLNLIIFFFYLILFCLYSIL